MNKNIEVSKIIDPIPASDGAGVKLKFLLLHIENVKYRSK